MYVSLTPEIRLLCRPLIINRCTLSTDKKSTSKGWSVFYMRTHTPILEQRTLNCIDPPQKMWYSKKNKNNIMWVWWSTKQVDALFYPDELTQSVIKWPLTLLLVTVRVTQTVSYIYWLVTLLSALNKNNNSKKINSDQEVGELNTSCN